MAERKPVACSTDTPRLLVLGGNRYNVPSIHRARESGFHVIVADRNPAAPGLAAADVGLAIDILDIEGLTETCRRHGVDGVVSLADVGVRSGAELAERFGLATIGRDAAARATSKAAMREAWAGLGPYSTRFRVASNTREALAAVDELAEFPLIFKPDRSFGGSRGVSRIENRDQVGRAFEFATREGLAGTSALIERFLVGSEHSCEVLIDGDRTSVLCIGRKIKSNLPYRVDISVQYPAPLSGQREARVADMCDKAIKALGLTTGTAHIEFVYTSDGPVLMELGARCGGGHTAQIASHVSGVDEFVEACRMACGSAPIGFEPTARRGADYRFLILPPGRIKTITYPDEVKDHPAVFDMDLTVESGDEILPLRTTAGRAGFAVIFSTGLEEASAQADWVCRNVIATYREGSTASAYTAADILEGTGSNDQN
ncbi:MAG: ATP-grasp domain-containing protein [bacterium]|nr:ATP-grasp domain-containing protein [bacterium]